MIDSRLTKRRDALIRACGDHWRIKAPYQSAADRPPPPPHPILPPNPIEGIYIAFSRQSFVIISC